MWKWLNGKKTYIGVIGISVVHGLEQVGTFPVGLGDQLLGLFKALAMIGAVHKADKMIVATKKGE